MGRSSTTCIYEGHTDGGIKPDRSVRHLTHWVTCEDGVVRDLNPLLTMTQDEFDQLDWSEQVLIENEVVLTDEQVKTLVFSIDPYPSDTTGLLHPLISLQMFKDVNIL